MASLALFAWLLTLSDANAAGRAYAIYGGVYIASSLLWMWAVEQVRPDRWDLIGVHLPDWCSRDFRHATITSFVRSSDWNNWSPGGLKCDPSRKFNVHVQAKLS